jgi:hypothetical protein
MAASPSREIHLARAKQVGEGVSPTLDAKVDLPRSAARIQEFARVTSARRASYSRRQLLAKAAIAASRPHCRASSCPKASVHSHSVATGAAAAFMMRATTVPQIDVAIATSRADRR